MIQPQQRFQIGKEHKWQCWAHHSTSGKRCPNIIRSREGEPIPIPYCDKHLKTGDGAVRVVKHPVAGKCLVARFDLPKRYKLAFFGYRGKCPTSDKEDRAISFYPPHKITGKNFDYDGERIVNYNGVLNPKGTGDVIQFAACPGPTERQNMRSTFAYFGRRNGCLGGLEFVTLENIPANTQLVHWYGSGWWSARGVKRIDVGIKNFPAPKRIKKNKEVEQKKGRTSCNL